MNFDFQTWSKPIMFNGSMFSYLKRFNPNLINVYNKSQARALLSKEKRSETLH